MFELPTTTPTMWERAGRAAFGSIGRAVRTAGTAFWRWPLRRPLLLAVGGLLSVIGVWKALHAPFDWRDVESDGSTARLLLTTGVLLVGLGARENTTQSARFAAEQRMSRGPHIQEQRPERQWPMRIVVNALGVLLVASGIEGFRHGKYWITRFNPYYGVVTTGPTLGLAVIGLVFIFIGVIPWSRSTGKRAKR